MEHTIDNNLRKWDVTYPWSKNGEEWSDLAAFCGQPYEAWKKSLVETFIAPHVSGDSVVLEIAPGHGRWSAELIGACKELILVDLSPSCIDHCRKRFASHNHVRYVTNDGKSLMGVEDRSVDFVWSFDSFVHMDRAVIGAYLAEIKRVLKPGAKAIIHHAGRRHALLWLGRIMSKGGMTGRCIARFITMGGYGYDAWRSHVSTRIVYALAMSNGLVVEAQVQSWGRNREFDVRKYRDFITILRCPQD